jgi:hypothetical protein
MDNALRILPAGYRDTTQAAEEHETRMRREQELNPPPAVKRLREVMQARYTASRTESNLASAP